MQVYNQMQVYNVVPFHVLKLRERHAGPRISPKRDCHQFGEANSRARRGPCQTIAERIA